MEQVSQFLEAHGYEMNFNDIKRKLREEGNGMGSDMVKMALNALVGTGAITVRNQGQKMLYSHKNLFSANGVSEFIPNE